MQKMRQNQNDHNTRDQSPPPAVVVAQCARKHPWCHHTLVKQYVEVGVPPAGTLVARRGITLLRRRRATHPPIAVPWASVIILLRTSPPLPLPFLGPRYTCPCPFQRHLPPCHQDLHTSPSWSKSKSTRNPNIHTDIELSDADTCLITFVHALAFPSGFDTGTRWPGRCWFPCCTLDNFHDIFA